MKFKVGDSFRAIVPFAAPMSIKVHIDHVIPSMYENQDLIIYRVYGKYKQYWHELMCTDLDMEYYKSKAHKTILF